MGSMIRSAEANRFQLSEKKVQVSCLIIIVGRQNLSVISSHSMAAPLHSKPAPAKTSHDNNHAQENNEKYTLYIFFYFY
jgi:hypothetical protein